MGAPIKSKAIYTGRNYDVGPWVDTHFIRCSRCGWINNTDRETHSNDGGYEGWGTTFTVVTSTSAGSGFGPNSPISTMQTPGPAGQMMFNTSLNSTDILVNTYGTFSFNFGGTILLNGVTTGVSGVLLLLYNSNMYYVSTASKWYQYTGSWTLLSTGDPRLQIGNIQYYDSEITYNSADPYDCLEPYIESTMDAVVGAGCSNCGTLLYTR